MPALRNHPSPGGTSRGLEAPAPSVLGWCSEEGAAEKGSLGMMSLHPLWRAWDSWVDDSRADQPGRWDGRTPAPISGPHALGCRESPGTVGEKPNLKGPKQHLAVNPWLQAGPLVHFWGGSPASESLPGGGAGFKCKWKGLGIGLPLENAEDKREQRLDFSCSEVGQ